MTTRSRTPWVTLACVSLAAIPAAQANRIIRTHQPPNTNGLVDAFGDTVLAMGDVDGDGFDDYAVSAPFDSLGFDGGANSGSVRMFSGQSGAASSRARRTRARYSAGRSRSCRVPARRATTSC